MSESIYLDYQSTTPCDALVVEAMLPYFTDSFQNAGSLTHEPGRKLGALVEEERENIAAFIGAQARDLIFTGSATEANNLAFHGLTEAGPSSRKKVLVSSIEHASVIQPAKALASKGFELVWLKVNEDGKVDIEHLKDSIDDQTLFVSIGHGNSEVGTLQDLKLLSDHCREVGAFFHVDATQALLTQAIDVESLQIDLLSMSAHKLYGPKGVGVLYRRRRSPRVRLSPHTLGGEQEWGLRAGTLNVPGIVGLSKACEIIQKRRDSDVAHFKSLKAYFLKQLKSLYPDLWVNGSSEGIPNNLNVGIPGLDAQSLMCEMPKVHCSKGSSCSRDINRPSHVLMSLGLVAEEADACLRFGFGRDTEVQELDRALEWMNSAMPKCRKRSLIEVVS